jgi:membrane protein required for colicin V production
MNYLDIIIAVPLLWGAYRGFMRGLVFEIAMLIGLVLGIYLAFKFSVLFEGVTAKYITSSESFLPYVSFLLVFALVVLIMILLAKLLERILKVGKLDTVNKVAGSVFGLIKYALVVSIVLSLFRPVDDRLHVLKKGIKEESFFYQPILKISQYIFPAINEVKEVFDKKL